MKFRCKITQMNLDKYTNNKCQCLVWKISVLGEINNIEDSTRN